MKIVLENIFMYLVTFWKCYFPPPPTQNPPPQNRITTKTPPPTPPQQQQKNQRSKARGFVCRSKSHRKSKSHRERDRFVGSWREGSRSPAKSKARGSKALGRRSVRGFVDRFVDQQSRRRDWRSRQSQRRDRFIDRWVHRSTKSKSKAVISEVGEFESMIGEVEGMIGS